jgi:hypothetical protein
VADRSNLSHKRRARCDGWTEDEIAVLEGFADSRDWIDSALAKLPGRTKAAARSMMQKVRLSLGISRSDTPWMADAVRGSAQLMDAIRRAGVHP